MPYPRALTQYEYFPSINSACIFQYTSCVEYTNSFNFSCLFTVQTRRQKSFTITITFNSKENFQLGAPVSGFLSTNRCLENAVLDISKDIIWTLKGKTLTYTFFTSKSVHSGQNVSFSVTQPRLISVLSTTYPNPVTASIPYKLYFDSVPGKDNQTIIRMYYSDYTLFPSVYQLSITYEIPPSNTTISYTPFYNGLTGDAVGSIGPGNDQYAIYYRVGEVSAEDQEKTAITRISPINNVSYISYDYDNPSKNTTFNGNNALFSYTIESNTVDNPFVPGNPSTNAYSESAQNTLTNSQTTNYLDSDFADTPQLQFSYSNDETGQKGVFKLDKLSTLYVTNHLDGGGLDPCVSTYLVCPGINAEIMQQSLTCGIVRIKVPYTYSPTLQPQVLTQQNYNVQYFSTGFHVASDPFPDLDSLPGFWTVNGTMLQKLQDEDGYAYIFYIRSDLWASYKAANPGFDFKIKTPPIIKWGKYTGYLCGQPTYAIIMRYKEADPEWVGNPVHACCYDRPATNKPIAASQLGGFVPEVYNVTARQETEIGNDYQNFINLADIGAVPQEGDWPPSTIPVSKC